MRLDESLKLDWDRPDMLHVDLTGRRPVFRILAEHEKGRKDRYLPMAPEFAEFLAKTPEDGRRGRVFKLVGQRGKATPMGLEWVSEVICRVGKAAGVKVHVHPTTGKVKFASAHDLRRSFGERWSHRVMSQVLMELMRHENIETTNRYYVGRNAQATANIIWAAAERVGTFDGTSPLSPTNEERHNDLSVVAS